MAKAKNWAAEWVRKLNAGARDWVYDPAQVEAICATLPQPVFSLAGAKIMDADEKIWNAEDGSLFFECETRVLGHTMRANDQTTRGSCVGHGFSRNIQDLMVNDIAIRGEGEEIPAEFSRVDPFVSVEATYGFSRVEIGGGRIKGDGSVGAWAAKAVQKCGVLYRIVYEIDGKKYDLRKRSAAREGEWGKRGVPDPLEPTAREHPVRTITLAGDGEQVWRANLNWYPTPFCSSQGFTTTRRGGFCEPRGTWHHCMGSCGAGIAKGGRKFILLRQSHGDSPTGGAMLVLESGREVTLPEGVFAVELDVIDSMVRRGKDTWVMSGHEGFQIRLPKWYM
jgi:hypothetical protein